MNARRLILAFALIGLAGLSAFALSEGDRGAARSLGSVEAPADAAPGAPEQESETTHFEAVHVYLDPGGTPLAAYQFELSAPDGRIEVVGVENGEPGPFGDAAPYYDRKAVQRGEAERIIIADFDTAERDQLPTDRTRVATVHLRVHGESPAYVVRLTAAATTDGTPIEPVIEHRKETAP